MGEDDWSETASESWNDQPPEPPALNVEDVEALVSWMDAMMTWLRRDESEARKHGHGPSEASSAVLRLYEASALLLREAYGIDSHQ